MSAEMIEMYAAEATRPMPDAGESVPARTGETPEPVPQPSVESQPEFTSQEEMIEKLAAKGMEALTREKGEPVASPVEPSTTEFHQVVSRILGTPLEEVSKLDRKSVV